MNPFAKREEWQVFVPTLVVGDVLGESQSSQSAEPLPRGCITRIRTALCGSVCSGQLHARFCRIFGNV